eukprot:2958468-Rhodomonas_salina.1
MKREKKTETKRTLSHQHKTKETRSQPLSTEGEKKRRRKDRMRAWRKTAEDNGRESWSVGE